MFFSILALYYPMIALSISICLTVGMFILVSRSIFIAGPANRRANEEENGIGASMADRIMSNSSVKAFSAEKTERSAIAHITDKWRVIEYKSWAVSHISGFIYELCLALAVGLGVFFCIHYTQQGVMPLSDVALVFFTILTINAYTRTLGRIFL